jgi:hypothetical protein
MFSPSEVGGVGWRDPGSRQGWAHDVRWGCALTHTNYHDHHAAFIYNTRQPCTLGCVVMQGAEGEGGPDSVEELDAQRARLVAEMLEEQQRVLAQQVGGGERGGWLMQEGCSGVDDVHVCPRT